MTRRTLTEEQVLAMHAASGAAPEGDDRIVLGASGDVETIEDDAGGLHVLVRTTAWRMRPGLVVRNIGPGGGDDREGDAR